VWLVLVAAAPAGQNLIANGSFEEQGPSGAVHWTLGEGATNGAHSPKSEVSWPTVDSSVVLKLTGTSTTMSWTSVQADPVPVTPGDTLVLSSRIRTQGVKREGNQYDNCGIAMKFVDANGKRVGMVGAPVVDGDHPWMDERVRAIVPLGAATVQPFAFLSKSGTAWFDDFTLETVERPPWITAQSDHFDFFWFAEAPISESMQQENEKALAHAAGVLGLTPPAARIAFYRYASKEQKGQLTGNAGNGHVQGGAVHSLFPVQEHELVHVLTQQWGTPDTALLGEGIAVYVGGQWQGRPIDGYAKELVSAGKVPPLTSLVSAFRANDDLMTYAVAGSFVGYLVRLKDIDAFERVYVAGAPLDQRLKSVYGKDLATLDADWRASLAIK
jgi:hypothetical protein